MPPKTDSRPSGGLDAPVSSGSDNERKTNRFGGQLASAVFNFMQRASGSTFSKDRQVLEGGGPPTLSTGFRRSLCLPKAPEDRRRRFATFDALRAARQRFG